MVREIYACLGNLDGHLYQEHSLSYYEAGHLSVLHLHGSVWNGCIQFRATLQCYGPSLQSFTLLDGAGELVCHRNPPLHRLDDDMISKLVKRVFG